MSGTYLNAALPIAQGQLLFREPRKRVFSIDKILAFQYTNYFLQVVVKLTPVFHHGFFSPSNRKLKNNC